MPGTEKVQSLAANWRRLFLALVPPDHKEKLKTAHELITAGFPHKIFDNSHVEHVMCELRKFLEGSTHLRGR